MWIILLLIIIFLSIGAIYGRHLEKKGITAENALEKYQQYLIWLIILIGIIVIGLVMLEKFKLFNVIPSLIPLIIRLYFISYYYYVLLIIGSFSIGLLIGLELKHSKNLSRGIQLFLGLVILTLPLSILVNRMLPIYPLLTQVKIRDNVVLQTTNYTCAPSTIATLTRWFSKNPLSEKDVAKITKTNRFGTSILREIDALKKLNFNPEFREKLIVNDLIKIKKPALLHVRETASGKTFPHAVALLSIMPTESDKKIFILGNPLNGIHQKTEEEMTSYWTGETIFINPN